MKYYPVVLVLYDLKQNLEARNHGNATSTKLIKVKTSSNWYIKGDLSCTRLCFRQTQAVGQLLPLGSHHVVVLLERALQAQELGRGEGRADAFGFPGEGTVEEQTVLGHVATWHHIQRDTETRQRGR